MPVILRQPSREPYWVVWQALDRPSAARIFTVPARRHRLDYRHDRDEQGDGHGRLNFGDAAWGGCPDHGCHPGCGTLQARTSQESATSLAGHAPYTRLVTPQALTQAGTKSPTQSGARTCFISGSSCLSEASRLGKLKSQTQRSWKLSSPMHRRRIAPSRRRAHVSPRYLAACKQDRYRYGDQEDRADAPRPWAAEPAPPRPE